MEEKRTDKNLARDAKASGDTAAKQERKRRTPKKPPQKTQVPSGDGIDDCGISFGDLPGGEGTNVPPSSGDAGGDVPAMRNDAAEELSRADDSAAPEQELVKEAGLLARLADRMPGKKGVVAVFGMIGEKSPACIRKALSSPRWMPPLAAALCVMMVATMAGYMLRQQENGENILRNGPERAYALFDAGKKEEAKRLWMQINANASWYMPFSGIGTRIDEPFLQKAAIAYQAQNWEDVAENAYKALNVPITDRQAVYVQQMILTATARMVRAYLPNQAEQPVKGGIPEHAAPICDPGTNIWIVPIVLMIVSALCLFGKMRIIFAIVALCMPLYFWGVSKHNEDAIRACEFRLAFDPTRIELYPMAGGVAPAAFRETNTSSGLRGTVNGATQETFMPVPIEDGK